MIGRGGLTPVADQVTDPFLTSLLTAGMEPVLSASRVGGTGVMASNVIAGAVSPTGTVRTQRRRPDEPLDDRLPLKEPGLRPCLSKMFSSWASRACARGAPIRP